MRSCSAVSTVYGGIRLFGLIAWLLPIQPISVPRLLGRMPAPKVRRAPTKVRSGPARPFAPVPAMRWQAEQPPVSNRRAPSTRHATGARPPRKLGDAVGMEHVCDTLLIL